MSGFQQPLFAPAQGGKVRIINVANVLGRNIFFAHYVHEIYVWKLTSVDTLLESFDPCIGLHGESNHIIHSDLDLEPHTRTLNAIGFGFALALVRVAFDWSSRESQIWT